MNTKEFNIVIGNVDEKLIAELFYLDTDEHTASDNNIIKLPIHTRWPELLKMLGIFSSTSQARKNGWNKDISSGWTDIRIGKLKHRICIIKEKW